MDMTKLLGSQIGLDDFIFVHRKGNLKKSTILLYAALHIKYYIIKQLFVEINQ